MQKFFLRCKLLALDLLFPPQCCGCGATGMILCALCADGLMRIPPQCFVCHSLVPANVKHRVSHKSDVRHSVLHAEVDVIPPGRTCSRCRSHSAVYAFLSPFSYQYNAMRELVHSLKYRRNREAARLFGDMLASHLAALHVIFPKNAVLIPVPLHKARQRERGFNQSLLIAKSFGEKLDIEVGRNVLKKIKKTVPQMELSREERLRNLRNTFFVQNPMLVHGKNVILIDDVKTTGATLEECARILKKSGARQIWAITVAH